MSLLAVPQPCLVVAEGPLTAPIATVHLVVERKVVALMPAKKATLSAFYVFNMNYTEGCLNFYKALEVFFLKGKRDVKRLKLSYFLSDLDL